MYLLQSSVRTSTIFRRMSVKIFSLVSGMSSPSVAIKLDLALSGSHNTLAELFFFADVSQLLLRPVRGIRGASHRPFTWMSTKRTKPFTDPPAHSDFSSEF